MDHQPAWAGIERHTQMHIWFLVNRKITPIFFSLLRWEKTGRTKHQTLRAKVRQNDDAQENHSYYHGTKHKRNKKKVHGTSACQNDGTLPVVDPRPSQDCVSIKKCFKTQTSSKPIGKSFEIHQNNTQNPPAHPQIPSNPRHFWAASNGQGVSNHGKS